MTSVRRLAAIAAMLALTSGSSQAQGNSPVPAAFVGPVQISTYYGCILDKSCHEFKIYQGAIVPTVWNGITYTYGLNLSLETWLYQAGYSARPVGNFPTYDAGLPFFIGPSTLWEDMSYATRCNSPICPAGTHIIDNQSTTLSGLSVGIEAGGVPVFKPIVPRASYEVKFNFREPTPSNPFNDVLYFGTMTMTSQIVTPEPSTYVLMAAGLVGVGLVARGRKRA